MGNEEPRLLMFWTEFCNWLFSRTDKFPKKARFSITNRLDNLALDVVEKLIEARYGKLA